MKEKKEPLLFCVLGLDLTERLTAKIEAEYLAREAEAGLPIKRTQAAYKLRSHLEKYYYVVHRIYVEQHLWRATRPDSPCRSLHFVPLNLDRLREYLGTNYATTILQDLLDWGIIECDQDFHSGEAVEGRKRKEGGKSRGYRLTARWRGVIHQKTMVVHNEVFETRIRTLGQRIMDELMAEQAQSLPPQECAMREKLKACLHKLLIREDAARAYVSAKLRNTYGTADLVFISDWHNKMEDPTYDKPMTDEERVWAQRWRQKPGSTQHRRLVGYVFRYGHGEALETLTWHQYTQTLRQEARAYKAYLKGERTHRPATPLTDYVDQLYVQGQYEHDDFCIDHLSGETRLLSRDPRGKRVHHILTFTERNLRGFVYHVDYPHEPLVVDDCKNSQLVALAAAYLEDIGGLANAPAAERAFIDWAQDGVAYEQLQQLLGLGDIPREQLKRFIYTHWLFSSEKHASDFHHRLLDQLEHLSAFVSRIKGYELLHPLQKPEFKGRHRPAPHARMATNLQALEAGVVIDNVMAGLLAEDRFCVPIHDATVSLLRDADLANERMQSAWWTKHNLRVVMDRKVLALPVIPASYQMPADWTYEAPQRPRNAKQEEAYFAGDEGDEAHTGFRGSRRKLVPYSENLDLIRELEDYVPKWAA